MARPPATVDIREVQVIKHDRTFFVSNRFGDVPEGNTAALGLYQADTRFLSRLEVTLNQLRPLLLHSSTERNYSQIVELVYPVRHVLLAGPERKDNISLQRRRVLHGSLFERMRIRNFGLQDRRIGLTVSFESDFLDIFEVRGMAREERGEMLPPEVDRHSVVLGYRGLDGVTRSTTLRFSPAPETLSEREASFDLEVAAGDQVDIVLEIEPHVGDAAPTRRSMREIEQELEQVYAAWEKRSTRFGASDVRLQGFLRRAVRDLRMLSSTGENGTRFIDAGIPWYSAMFGRDSLITAYQALTGCPKLAWSTLRGLAALQGKVDDPWREEEPGKILHELRVGELAGADEIPHTPYYGSIDATPLWLVVLGAAFRWTGDREALRELWPNALAALRWIDEHGDRDGDGYVEYERRSPRGLDNQGWKDSWDGVPWPDGTPVEPPIALVEVQGYVYQAKSLMAQLAREMGEEGLAARLESEAAELKERFNRDFWEEETGFFALALDGRKRRVPTITSNPGHCLWSRIVDRRLAPQVVKRLMDPGLLSGWGIRTLSSRHPVYDPIGYHTGTIWPHDNSLIAQGLKRYGFDAEAQDVLDQLTAAGRFFPYSRFPEVFCGFSSDEVPVPVEYPVACRPHAWASAAPLLMVRAYGGLSADSARRRLTIERPRLPDWLTGIELRGMHVAGARLDLSFVNSDGVTAVKVDHKRGDLEVVIRQ
ncbi:MAG TPA: glycogen debranching N-terminal domain-containing protein [Actinomycetota bacterium]